MNTVGSLVMHSAETILLADDNQDDVLLMRCAIRRAGFDVPVVVVEDGEAVVHYLESREPFGDCTHSTQLVVVLEARLPRGDAFDVLRWIREQPGLQSLPVVVMTGAGDAWQTQKATALGASACLEKPLAYGDLVDLVRTKIGLFLAPFRAAA